MNMYEGGGVTDRGVVSEKPYHYLEEISEATFTFNHFFP